MKTETFKELKEREEEYFWNYDKEDLLTHCNVMILMLKDDKWHPDYRG